jgi:hypothetical protein
MRPTESIKEMERILPMADDNIEPKAPEPVRKLYWVIHTGRVDGRIHRRGDSVTLTVAEAARYRSARVGLSFVKPDPDHP